MSKWLAAKLRHPLLGFVLVLAPFFLNLGGSALWDASEAFYGETAREMLERSDLIFPTFNYQPRNQKPPLTYWCIAAAYRLIGINEFSTRLPAAIAICFLLAGVVWFLGHSDSLPIGSTQKSGGAPGSQRWATGLLAISILATTPRFFIVARRLPIDCFLTVFLSLSLLLLYRALGAPDRPEQLVRDGPSQVVFHRYWQWAAAGICLGLAFLTKGPVAPLLAALITGIFSWWEKLRPKAAAILTLIGVFLLTTVPYYVILFRRGGGSILYDFLIDDNLLRYTSLDFGPLRGDVYYLRLLLIDAFPWSWFLPAVAWHWKRGQSSNPRLFHLCLVWFAVVVLFFSFSKNKQEYYILPAYVALAIWLAQFFQTLRRPSEARSRMLAATSILVAFTIVGVGGILIWLNRFLPIKPASLGIALLLSAAASLFLWLSLRGRLEAAVRLLAVSLLLVVSSACLSLLPALETVRPTRRLTAEIAELWRPGDRAGYFRFTSPSMSFYLKSAIFELYDLDSLQSELERPGRSFLLVRQDEFDRLPWKIRGRLEIIDSAPEFQTRGRVVLKIRKMKRLPRVLLVREKTELDLSKAGSL